MIYVSGRFFTYEKCKKPECPWHAPPTLQSSISKWKKWHHNDYKIKQSILIEALSNTQDTIDTSWTYQNSSSEKTSSNRLNDKHKTSSLPFGLPHLIAPKFHPPCGTLAAPKNRSFLTFFFLGGGVIDDDNIWNISIIYILLYIHILYYIITFNCEGEHVWEGETKGPEETISLSAPVETVNISQYNATCTRFWSCFIHPQMASSTSPKVNTIGADLLLADQPHQWSFWWASNLDWHLMGLVISPVETWKETKFTHWHDFKCPFSREEFMVPQQETTLPKNYLYIMCI